VTLDQSNKPVLRPSDQFKVVFESPITGGFDELASIFEDGQLITEATAIRTANRDDLAHLVIEILLTVKPS